MERDRMVNQTNAYKNLMSTYKAEDFLVPQFRLAADLELAKFKKAGSLPKDLAEYITNTLSAEYPEGELTEEKAVGILGTFTKMWVNLTDKEKAQIITEAQKLPDHQMFDAFVQFNTSSN